MAEEDRSIRVAAVGDIHCREANREPLARSIAAISDADLLLIAGDITSHGTVEEAQILCEVTAGVDFPVFAVLGNHDLHAGQAKEIVETLRAGGIDLLDGTSAISEIRASRSGLSAAGASSAGSRRITCLTSVNPRYAPSTRRPPARFPPWRPV